MTAAPDRVTEPVIRIRDGEFGYGNTVAAHVDLAIDAGEFVAVLGPNGSGKSTLREGDARPRRSARRRRRVVRPAAPSGRSVARRVRAAAPDGGRADPGHGQRTGPVGTCRVGWLVAPPRRRRSRRSGAAIDVVGLADDARTPVSQLSGGQQRRAMVARGLASGADVLMLDEPLAGVDAASQTALADTLGTLAAAGTTDRDRPARARARSPRSSPGSST